MQAALQETNEHSITPDFTRTDPDQEIQLSEDHHVHDNMPVNFTTTYRRFFERLSQPSDRLFEKDGPGWMNGRCNGRRAKANFESFWLVVLDADASIDEHGQRIEGAPDPREVHQILKSANLSHHLYTTYSHGGVKGHRYRIVLPIFTKNSAELRGVLMYLAEVLQGSGAPIFLTRESYTIPNRWHYPRVETSGSPFYSATHWGGLPTPALLAEHYYQVEPDGRPAISTAPELARQAETGSIIDRFCSLVKITDLLDTYGYTFHGQHVLTDERGDEVLALRYRPAGSTSPPGVMVLEVDGKQRVYSHHTTDPLAGGVARDSYDAYMVLNSIDENVSLVTARDVIEEIEVANMNREYPTVSLSGKFRFAFLEHDHNGAPFYSYMTKEDFKSWCANDPGIPIIQDGMVTTAPRFNWWYEHPKRIRYNNVCFTPYPLKESLGRPPESFHEMREGKPYFNLFSGWAIKPKRGYCERIKWHIKNALCSGDEEHYEYFLDWLAHLVQYPQQKPGVAVVLRGAKGIGKSMFTSALIRAISPMGASISNSKHWTSNFNSLYENKLLIVLEESFFAGNPGEEGILKASITQSEDIVESKNVNKRTAVTYYRLFIITNNMFAAPASDDERRYFAPVTSTTAIDRNREERGAYFTELFCDLNGKSMNAFMYELMERKIDLSRIGSAPNSIELQKQKLYSLSGPEAWLGDFLQRGAFEGSNGRAVIATTPPRTNPIPVSDLLAGLAPYSNRYDSPRGRIAKALDRITEILGPIQQEELAGETVLNFPDLNEMRIRFGRKFDLEDGWWRR